MLNLDINASSGDIILTSPNNCSMQLSTRQGTDVAINTVYYAGGNFGSVPTIYYGDNLILSPVKGTVTKIVLSIVQDGSINCTTEAASIYLRLNDTTDYLITNSFTFNGNWWTKNISNLLMNAPLNINDTWAIKLVTPTTMVTLPKQVGITGAILIEN